MKAARIQGIGQPLKIEDISKPEVPDGWSLIKVRAAGVCGTELHILDGLLPPGKIPMTLGHEISGEVIEVPKDSGFNPGDRVCVYNLMNCGKCKFCINGHDELCEHAIGQIGFTHDGGFAEYVAVPTRNLVSLPIEASFSDGALHTCAGMTAVHAVKLAGIGLLDTVVVNGVGGVGIMVAQMAKIAGARVIAVADSNEKADLMKEIGIEESIVISNYDSLPEDIRKMTDGCGADAFFELVGTSESSEAGLKSLAKTGRYVIIGYTKDHIDVDPLWMVIGELKLMAVVAGSKKDLEDVVELAKRGQIKTIIQSELELKDINYAIDLIKSRKSLGRNVIVF